EAHVRALLLQAVAGGKLQLRSLYSEDLEDQPDRVSIEAELVTQERNDAFMEQIVSRLSLDSGVTATRWRIIEQEFG
ncbi:MAG: MgtC/SapB family protein, partial [Cyanobacteriota bacterium]